MDFICFLIFKLFILVFIIFGMYLIIDKLIVFIENGFLLVFIKFFEILLLILNKLYF